MPGRTGSPDWLTAPERGVEAPERGAEAAVYGRVVSVDGKWCSELQEPQGPSGALRSRRAA